MDEAEAAALCDWHGPPLRLVEPDSLATATVFSSAHSGRIYPEGFRRMSRLSAIALRASEDAFVDDLFSCAPEYGAPLLVAEFPRAFADPNRAEDELDPALISRFIGRRPRTLRVSAGLGVVPRIVAEGTPIYDGKLKLSEVQARIACCYRPYHEQLKACLDRSHGRFGVSLLVDCHSMPSENSHRNARRADIILGDCYGSSADADLSDAAYALFRDAGFRVARNAPFAGGYITQKYGQPKKGRHALQIEIDRELYLDQRNIVPNARYDSFKSIMKPVIAGLAALPERFQTAMAAE